MSENECFHCGDTIVGRAVTIDSKAFCCSGCATVYQLLSENNLGEFYSLEQGAGIKPSSKNAYKYAFLDVTEIRAKHITYEDQESVHLTLFLPTIHCSSCIYLLENIQQIEPRVLSCNVNFVRKTASIILKKEMPLSEFALLLDSIGYAPNFGDKKALSKQRNYTYLFKLGVAGFAFGSIMLWTFPEYLGIENDNPEIRTFTAYLSLLVSIPVLLYSASDYLKSAYKAIKFRRLNLDVPISLGILALYAQSVFNIVTDQGSGYMDSFAGFVFFLLIGKWFQSKTYESLSFERDYTAYFPVAVTRYTEQGTEIIEIDKIQIGDQLKVRNEEIIPCDATLLSERVEIDYSFVTGESDPVILTKGDFVYAGGKVLGKPCNFRVEKESNRSQLTQIWNESDSQNSEDATDTLSIYFLSGVLILALLAAIIWSFLDPNRIVEIVVAVLIVACPCALALSKPFTYGNITRILGRKGLYLKSASVIEKLNQTTDIVFDKTGTLTSGKNRKISYKGAELSLSEQEIIASLTGASSHPLSAAISTHLLMKEISLVELDAFEEVPGHGILGKCGETSIEMGKAGFIGAKTDNLETEVHVKINGQYKGKFLIESSFRTGIFDALRELKSAKAIHVVSGDSQKDKATLKEAIPGIESIHFRQTPEDKRDFIENLQKNKLQVLMIGDGLNDAGALKKANVGIAISEDIFRFTPGSDAIIDADSLSKLPEFLNISRYSKRVLTICFGFSILYNLIGLTFAIFGELTPLIAAILMPISSISIVFISTIATNLKSY